MITAEYLVQGVDLWINTPRRPWEACGTSGMKILVNGGLNPSELDGWWAEAYSPEVGWSLNGLESELSDHQQAQLLLELLENEIVPDFYDRNASGIPERWVTKMRASMVTLTPYFSANWMVREYTERFYLPLAENYHKRTANNAGLGLSLTIWLARLDDLWPKIHIDHIEIEQRDNQHFFSLQIYLGDLTAQDVTVEVYSDPTHNDTKNVHAMRLDHPLPGAVNGYAYSLSIRSTRPILDYTPRLRPNHPDCLIPLETHHILWVR